jgi:glyoxylase-like metal-dependent hydrolase (beta-lactamase superfamily II)
VVRVLAPNPGPFTLDGTNTWVVGTGPGLVIDPGPDDAGHLEAVMTQAGEIGAILVTHHHPDHASGASRLSRMSGAVVMAASPLSEEEAVHDGAIIEAGTVTLRAVATPGHTPDHLVFHDERTGSLFTGDAVLGRGTSVIDPPEGDLAAYLRSLEAMIALEPLVIYPGHGPVVRPAVPKLVEDVSHRQDRDRQVLQALRGGARMPEEVVPEIYAGYPQDLHPAAARSVLAHLLKLEREGRVVRVSPSEDRFALPEKG